jgi:hypothetical protein
LIKIGLCGNLKAYPTNQKTFDCIVARASVNEQVPLVIIHRAAGSIIVAKWQVLVFLGKQSGLFSNHPDKFKYN